MLDVCCGSGDLAFLLSEKVGINGKVYFPHHLLYITSTFSMRRSEL